jgi:hypothetical protein
VGSQLWRQLRADTTALTLSNAFTNSGSFGLGRTAASSDLDFDNVLQEALPAILNDNPLADQVLTDLLSTKGNGSMGPFSLTSCLVTKLPGGESQGGCDAFFDTADLGDFSDVFSFPVESNSSGCDEVIGNVTLAIEGEVASSTPAPEPGTISLLGSGLGMLSFVIRRRSERMRVGCGAYG